MSSINQINDKKLEKVMNKLEKEGMENVKTLQEKESVSFNLDRGPKGLKAQDVMRLEAEAEVEA